MSCENFSRRQTPSMKPLYISLLVKLSGRSRDDLSRDARYSTKAKL